MYLIFFVKINNKKCLSVMVRVWQIISLISAMFFIFILRNLALQLTFGQRFQLEIKQIKMLKQKIHFETFFPVKKWVFFAA